MKTINGKWLAVTAGVGMSDFEEAAYRVREALLPSAIVDKVVAVTTSDLPAVCPETSVLYRELMNTDTRGYGYMCWKAEVVHAAMQGKWGDFDGVIWIDAGCEVSINPLSISKFRKFQLFAQKNGVACFTLDTLEIEYTKRDLFDKFPEVSPQFAGKQIQTTWFLLHGERGRSIAKEWFEAVMLGTNLLDLNPSSNPEYVGFIENRYDQSIFSLVCKKNKVPVMKYKPTAGTGSYISILRGLVNPIWTSRNRRGESLKKKIHTSLEIKTTKSKVGFQR
jgi:hypothetical protein